MGDGNGRYRRRSDPYDNGVYEDYEDDGPYEGDEDYDEGYDGQPGAMRSYGVDRADYYNDNHAPLVTQADVRSQPIPVLPTAMQNQDRIPPPRIYRRGSDSLARLDRGDDSLAFKGGLARTPGSFAQLQSERLRMENTGRLTAVDGSAAGAAGAAGVGSTSVPAAGIGQPSLGQSRVQAHNFGPNRVLPRVHRRVECIRPMTYADAEQVAQELRRGVVVVLDIRPTRPELAKRILDFSFGVASALEGQVDRYIDRVYVFTRNGPLTDEERASIRI
jgi:cell division inhibitor SepF